MNKDSTIKCDFYGLDAKFNFQKTWVKFVTDKDGYYKEDKDFSGCGLEEPVDKNNVHLCDCHLDKWLSNQIQKN